MINPQTQLIACILLAAVPVAVWGYIFYQKRPEDRYLTAITFLTGGLAVFPILLYKYSWRFFPWMNAFAYTEKFDKFEISLGALATVPLSVVMTFMIVGVIEEWMKHIVVRFTDDDRLCSIDDAISFSIIAALGFSFVENILYFYDIWLHQGMNNLVLPFVFRSLFSTFAHVMFSGIFGYFYGVARFASPILKEMQQSKRSSVVKMFHRMFKFKTAAMFHREKILEGLVVATVLHAIFNIALELNLAFVIVPFLSGGYFILDWLLKQKENHKVYNVVSERPRKTPLQRLPEIVNDIRA